MTALATCPSCQTPLPEEATDCTACGLALSGRRPRPERPWLPPRGSGSGAPPPRRALPLFPDRVVRLLVFGILGGFTVSGAYWWHEIRPRLARIENREPGVRPEPARTLQLRSDTVADFDRRLELPFDPLGLTVAGDSLLLANREEPWGFARLRPLPGDRFASQKIAVLEKTYDQRVGFATVASDGTRVVGYAEGSWFQRSDDAVFTLHEPESLRILSVRPAPAGLGCLTWDGTSFWGATRLDTWDSDEPAYLYRLSRALEVSARFPSPAKGCQGLAWDGRLLWLADVFTASLYAFDLGTGGSGEPRLVHQQDTGVDYLSGLAFFDDHLWFSEYGNDRLYRINDRLRLAWSKGQPRTPRRSPIPLEAPATGELAPTPSSALPLEQPLAPTAERSTEGDPLSAPEIARLRAALHSDDAFERNAAEMTLQRAGIPVDYDRDTDSFAPEVLGPEEVSVDDWAVEIRDGTVRGWWRIRFGAGLFEGDERIRLFGPVTLPLFARYEVTLEGGNLPKPIEHTFDAHAGENRVDGAVLATGLGPGGYTANLFVHVQFVDAEGNGRILNQSAMFLQVEQ